MQHMGSTTSSTASRMTLVLTPVGSETTQPPINRQITSPVDSVEHVDTEHSAPQMEHLNITKEKRQQLRRLLINSQPLTLDETARQGLSRGFSLTDHGRKAFHKNLDETVRWNTFLTHSHVNLPEIIASFSYEYLVNEEEYQLALAKAVESHESLKATTCSNIQKHATCLVRANKNLHELDNAALTQKVSDSFSPDKFFDAFTFMEDYLNFEDSSALGKWYAEGIYINMTRTAI
jgi:hypothetical protein